MVARVVAVVSAAAVLNSVAMAGYDFDKAWKDVAELDGKGLPRSVTNKVAEIAREATAAKRWPDVARAFLAREQAMSAFTDGEARPDEWLPAFAASVDAQPAPLQAVLQLHLAHTYLENSRPWRWGGARPTKLDDEAAKDKMPPWSPEKINATLESQFTKVFAHEVELKSQKLSDWKAIFQPGTLPELYCPTLFDFAVHDMIGFYGATIPDKTLEKGLALYDRLIAFHREDGNLDAFAMAELDRAEYVREFGRTPWKERDEEFGRFLDGFIARLDGRSEVVAIAAAKKADRLRRDKGGLVAAHDLAAKYAARYKDAPGGKMCAGIVAEIERKELHVVTERNWCAPWPEIKVSARNVAEAYFRLVPVTFDELAEDTTMGSNRYNSRSFNAMKGKYLNRTPAKEWKESLPLKPDYSSQAFNFPVPQGLPCGHYILFAASNEKFGSDKLPLFARHITVTSLALVLETGNGSFNGTVYRAEAGTPVAGATVEMWWYGPKGGRAMKCLEQYVTDSDGRFTADVSKGRGGVLRRHVRVVKDGEEVLSFSCHDSGYVDDEKDPQEHIELFTDRSIYRPGQEIKVKGIAYHATPENRDFRVQTQVTVRLALNDPNGKEVASARVKPNRWGSFTHAFSAPEGRLTGRYTINAWYLLMDGRRGEAIKVVRVEEYKRPKFTVEFERASAAATLGRPMTVTGKAKTYSGLPVQDAKVEWRVNRRTRYPGWWSWFGGGGDDDGESFVGKGEARTDADGVFSVTFTPVASPTADLAGDPTFRFTVEADVTDGTGEGHSASESFEVGTVAWRADLHVKGNWNDAKKPIPVQVALSTLSGKPVPVKGTLKALRLKAPKRPVRKPVGGLYEYARNEKGPWDWKSWEPGEEAFSLDIAGGKAERWEGSLKLGVGAYRLVFETKDPDGKNVKDIDSVFVFDSSAKELGVAVPEFFSVEDAVVRVGGTLRAYWGTGYETGVVRVRVTNNRKVIFDELVGRSVPDRRGALGTTRPTTWYYELPIKDEHRGELRIETTFVRENRIYHNHETISVPWDNKYLEIKAEHMTSKLVPGGEETWKFKVSGPAEVLAFMYDKSLDAYNWHDVSLGFSRWFTPWSRWLGRPVLHNDWSIMQSLGGSFPAIGRHGFDMHWPMWRPVFALDTIRMKSVVASRAMKAKASNDFVVEETSGTFCASACAAPACAPPPDCIEHEPAMFARMESNGAGGGEPPKDVPPRSNLKETAFFFPQLETDADGNVSFTFTAPDALTGWKLLMVAHDSELNGGVFRNDEIVTTKPLMCEPLAPRFVREGDDFLFAVKVTNTDDSPQSGEVELRVCELGVGEFEAASNSSTPPLPHSSTSRFSLAPHESKTYEFRLAIPDGCGFLKYVAKAKGETFTDGAAGVLPVLSRRMLVREAVQLDARGKETKSFKFDNLLASKGSDTIRHQDLTVRAVSRPMWYAVLSLPYLMEFPHECCEQTFSRFYANALGEFIANADPRIRETFDAWKAAGAEALKSPLEANPALKAIALEATPWVREAEHETAARARLGDLFSKERLAAEQERCIEKLRAERGGDGLWPWFPGGPSSSGITLYILSGFARLNRLAGLEYPDFFEGATAALDENVSEDVKRRLRSEKENKIPFRVNGFDVRWLYLHSFAGVPKEKNKKDAQLFVKHLANEWPDLGLESQALAAIALKRMGEDGLAREIMASVKERGVLSDELGMYWKVPYFFSSSVFAAPVSTQALIVEAFREVTGDEESADACNVWLLKQKQTQDWTTTAATADAIYALLLGGGAAGVRALPVDLLVGDKLAEVTLGGVKVPTGNAEKGTGMWSVRYAADEIKPEMGEITFKGTGEKGVAWGGVHWSYFEDVLKVRAHEPKELRVEKKYYKKTKGAGGTRLAAVGDALEPGDELVARLEITSDRTYEFVHLSDARPSCAEPEDVLSAYRWQDGVGYYQSTRDAATHYYIDRLNKGVFVIETSYRVRQRGTFAGGIATIQCMYAPEFTAHSTAEAIRVGGGASAR